MKNITIERLFGEHDIKIDLDNKLSIMIGENGIGKTTILNILYAIYRYDFVSLTKYTFDKVIMAYESTELVIYQSDLFPALEVLLSEIEGKIEDYDSNQANAYFALSTGLRKAQKYKGSIYHEFLAACLHSKPLSNRIKQNIESSCYDRYTDFFDPIAELQSVMLSKIHNSNSMLRKKHSYLLQSKIGDRIKNDGDFIKTLNQFFNKPIVSLNMVNKYAIKDDVVNKPAIYSNMIQWLSKYNQISYNSRFNDNKHSFLDLRIYKSPNLIGLPMFTPDEYKNSYIDLVKVAYKNVEYNFFDINKDIDRITEEVTKDEIIDVNGIINRFYYTEEYMKQINEEAISYYMDLIGEAYDYDDYTNAYYEFNAEERSNIENYIKPIILEDSIFAGTISQILNPSFDTNHEQNTLIMKFKEFYDNNIDSLINERNPKIKELERLLNEFANSKTFIITPAGLKVFLNKYNEYDSGKFRVMEYEKNELSISDLSSGEKKLVIILLFSCLFEDVVLFLDEPELSFSINWQEKILSEITNQDNNNSFLVATHSPFIISNEEISKSIIPLPMEE